MGSMSGRSTVGRLAALVAVVLVVVAACGSTSTAPKSTLTQVIERGVLRVATNPGTPGLATLDANGQLVGYDIDIANMLAAALGVKAEIIQTDGPGRVTQVQTGKADATISGFTRNLERMKVINFTDPILQESVVLITTPDKTDLNTVSDFNKPGIKISVVTGGTQVEEVAKVLPLAEAVAFPGAPDALTALLSGQVDAATVANTGVGLAMQTYPDKLKPVEGNVSAPQDDGIGLPLNDFAWWNFVNTFVHTINEDGTNLATWQKWFGEGTTPGPFAKAPLGG